MPTDLGFGPRIKAARLIRRMSQQALADAVGVSKMAISKYERGLINPSSKMLIAIAAATDFQMSFFLRRPAPIEIELIHWHGM